MEIGHQILGAGSECLVLKKDSPIFSRPYGPVFRNRVPRSACRNHKYGVENTRRSYPLERIKVVIAARSLILIRNAQIAHETTATRSVDQRHLPDTAAPATAGPVPRRQLELPAAGAQILRLGFQRSRARSGTAGGRTPGGFPRLGHIPRWAPLRYSRIRSAASLESSGGVLRSRRSRPRHLFHRTRLPAERLERL